MYIFDVRLYMQKKDFSMLEWLRTDIYLTNQPLASSQQGITHLFGYIFGHFVEQLVNHQRSHMHNSNNTNMVPPC